MGSKLPRPTAADYLKREELENTRLGSNEHLQFLNSLDWSPELFEESGKNGLKNAMGEVIVPPLFEDFMTLGNHEIDKGEPVSTQANGKWGVVLADGKGTWLVEPEYDYIGYPNRLTHVLKEGKWGVLDIATNEFIVPLECDKVVDHDGFLFMNDIGIFMKDGKYGLVTPEGRVTRAIFDDIVDDCEGWVEVQYNGEWGYINEQGEFTDDMEQAFYAYDL